MDNLFNIKTFHESTTEELNVIKDRVRNLIGDSNWAEEGRYKESILRNVIKRFLPRNLIVGTGFIVKIVNQNYQCSKQIDILIFDSSYPILFSEGDFYIVTKKSVKAVIEVKSNIQNQDIPQIIERMNEIGFFLCKDKYNSNIFNGIFSFEGYDLENYQLERRIKDKIKRGIKKNNYLNHISLNEDIFLKFWSDRKIFSVYKLKKLSFSFFISNLIYTIIEKPIRSESEIWFPKNKEKKKLFDIFLFE